MSKLLSLKEWITLGEAASHLSSVAGEVVSIADLYRFALAGHLVLSVNFVNHADGNPARKIPIQAAGFSLHPGLQFGGDDRQVVYGLNEYTLPHFEAWLKENPDAAAWLAADEPKSKWVRFNGLAISDDDCLQIDFTTIGTLTGLWDLPMIGAERLDIEHALQGETGGPAVELISVDGAFVCGQDGTYARIVERYSDNEYADVRLKKLPLRDPNAYYPANGIPADAPIVVRPVELVRFISTLSDPQNSRSDKPFDERERTTLLCIIGALAREAKLDLSQPMKAGDIVADHLAPELKLSGRTVGEKLKLVADAMDRRTK